MCDDEALEHLPVELLAEIMCRCSLSTAAALGQTSKRLFMVYNDDDYWLYRARHDFPAYTALLSKQLDKFSARVLCKRLYLSGGYLYACSDSLRMENMLLLDGASEVVLDSEGHLHRFKSESWGGSSARTEINGPMNQPVVKLACFHSRACVIVDSGHVYWTTNISPLNYQSLPVRPDAMSRSCFRSSVSF
jgi:hypothetical protein